MFPLLFASLQLEGGSWKHGSSCHVPQKLVLWTTVTGCTWRALVAASLYDQSQKAAGKGFEIWDMRYIYLRYGIPLGTHRYSFNCTLFQHLNVCFALAKRTDKQLWLESQRFIQEEMPPTSPPPVNVSEITLFQGSFQEHTCSDALWNARCAYARYVKDRAALRAQHHLEVLAWVNPLIFFVLLQTHFPNSCTLSKAVHAQ